MTAAFLGRLKQSLRVPGGGNRSADRKSKPLGVLARVALPWLPLAIGIGATGLIAGVGIWLVLTADQTAQERIAAVPRITVAVAAAVPAASKPEPSPPSAPTKPEPAKPEPAKPEPAKPEPAKPEPGKPEPAKPEAEAALEPPFNDASVTLTPAPLPELIEDSPDGPLPRIGPDNKQPWVAYARPFPKGEKRPRVAIIMVDLGMSGATTGIALQKLPPVVSFAFVPFAERLDSWVDAARKRGHEVLLSVPMEPFGYPRDDPGPKTLLTRLNAAGNLERLNWSLSRTVGYIGITTGTGTRFMTDANALRPLLEALKARGLMFLDARLTPASIGAAQAEERKQPWAMVNRVLDLDPSRGAIDAQLRALENDALKNGAAVGIAQPYPTTIERITQWLPTVGDRRLVAAPVSAVVGLQKPP